MKFYYLNSSGQKVYIHGNLVSLQNYRTAAQQDVIDNSIKSLLQSVRDKLASGDISGAVNALDAFLLDGSELA